MSPARPGGDKADRHSVGASLRPWPRSILPKSLDGLGLLGFEAAINRDYPIMFATLYVFTLIGLVLKLISDLTYMVIDPRIDFGRR